MKNDVESRRGRPERDDVDRFQAMAWFNAVAYVLGNVSPTAIERLIQPENVSNLDGKLVTSRAWDKYKIGARLPNDGYKADGSSGAVIAAEKFVAESAYVFRHPIWAAMRSPAMPFDDVVRIISTLPSSAARYYMDLSNALRDTRASSLAKNIGQDIWIDRNDYYRSLDHLAAHLMILRLDIVRHLEYQRISCAHNIAKTLGPLAISPWIGPFHEEIFDWLEAKVWGDLFDKCYSCGNDYVKGWRKTKPEWLISYEGDV